MDGETALRPPAPAAAPSAARHRVADRTVGLLAAGYPYLLQLRRRWQAGAAQIRLLGRATTVVSGPEGARLFYDGSVMRRRDAIPKPLAATLFGSGAVHALDGAAHRRRKALFIGLLSPEHAHDVAERAAARWAERAPAVMQPEQAFACAATVHGAAVCEWAGVPEARVPADLSRDLAAIVDGFGSVGPRFVRAVLARRRAQSWAAQLIADVRSGELVVAAGAPLGVIAAHREDGVELPAQVAGVELLNILRPTVAAAYFVAFAAHALAADRDLRHAIGGADDNSLERFAQEVRRHYPFVPVLAARADRDTEFAGCPVPEGRRVILDVYGTLHDARYWADPDRFDAARVPPGEQPDRWTFFPQGAGEVDAGHRCPGERVVIELVKTSARVLAERLPADAAPPRFSLRRMPARPVRSALPRRATASART